MVGASCAEWLGQSNRPAVALAGPRPPGQWRSRGCGRAPWAGRSSPRAAVSPPPSAFGWVPPLRGPPAAPSPRGPAKAQLGDHPLLGRFRSPWYGSAPCLAKHPCRCKKSANKRPPHPPDRALLALWVSGERTGGAANGGWWSGRTPPPRPSGATTGWSAPGRAPGAPKGAGCLHPPPPLAPEARRGKPAQRALGALHTAPWRP